MLVGVSRKACTRNCSTVGYISRWPLLSPRQRCTIAAFVHISTRLSAPLGQLGTVGPVGGAHVKHMLLFPHSPCYTTPLLKPSTLSAAHAWDAAQEVCYSDGEHHWSSLGQWDLLMGALMANRTHAHAVPPCALNTHENRHAVGNMHLLSTHTRTAVLLATTLTCTHKRPPPPHPQA